MSELKGFVTRITGDGSAEVVIQAEGPDCIPGAPEIDLCHHCTGCSAEVSIKALNRACAATGDLVYMSHQPGRIAKNALSLLGIPVIGLMLGTAAGVILYERATVHEIGAFLVAAAGILLGIIVGVRVYKLGSADNQPVITQIIRAGAKAPVYPVAIDPVCKMEVDASTAAAQLAHKGETYYFCHPACLKAFTNDPARYVVGEAETKRGELPDRE
jgi:YHS domain-containing protein